MRGVSPIISTILMVAIAIAAAIIVYYVTMDVITKQGAELEKKAQNIAGNVRIIAAEMDVNNDNDLIASEGDKLIIYYQVFNTDEKNLVKHDGLTVYIKEKETGNVVCTVEGSQFIVQQIGKLEFNGTKTGCGDFQENKVYLLKVSATDLTPSNEFEVKAT